MQLSRHPVQITTELVFERHAFISLQGLLKEGTAGTVNRCLLGGDEQLDKGCDRHAVGLVQGFRWFSFALGQLLHTAVLKEPRRGPSTPLLR
jgi:hypothetical protein